ncbi:hypothetical protein [Pseudoalteromonas sp. PB2-1]|uniref:hypothetical protein n=1 Tax=Pseudoalteromonas sp. PB2-1 TaxID=2907242 RepID=UPI00386AB5C5
MKITHDILTNTVAAQLKKTVPANERRTPDSTSEEFNKQQKQSFAADIYHKDEHIPKNQSTYDRPLSITAHKSESELLDKMTNTISFGELPKKLSQLRPKYENFLNELEVSSPSLVQKNWGFSINSDDKLVVFGDITEDEKFYLEGKLNADKDIVSLVKELPNTLIKGQEYDRGYDGKGKYWGKYDVTQDNFKDIIDVKALLDSSYGPNAKAFDNGFDIFSYQDNLRSQLVSKAEVKYAYLY